MPAARDDYILRMIQQAAAALRRLRERLEGGAEADGVVADASTAIGELLGSQRGLLERLDPASAAGIAGDPRKVAAWCDLLELQADAEQRRGNDAAAERLRARARSLSRNVQRTGR